MAVTSTEPYALSNPLAVLLGKPPADFTRADMLRVIAARGIERVTFHYTGIDGKLKELRIPVADPRQAEIALVFIGRAHEFHHLGVVGGLGLAGTMTMNVVERSREIGVMRAIGARDRSVLAVFLTDGLLIGLLAWIVGVLISLPISKILSDALGMSFVQRPLEFTPSLDGILLWGVVVAVLAIVASFLPAWRATRLAVREVLAYE